MTTQQDYEATLEYFIKGVNNKTAYVFFDKEKYNTIVKALRLAAKVMQEPSEGMKHAGIWVAKPIDIMNEAEVFKAMRDQMLKEISDAPR